MKEPKQKFENISFEDIYPSTMITRIAVADAIEMALTEKVITENDVKAIKEYTASVGIKFLLASTIEEALIYLKSILRHMAAEKAA